MCTFVPPPPFSPILTIYLCAEIPQTLLILQNLLRVRLHRNEHPPEPLLLSLGEDLCGVVLRLGVGEPEDPAGRVQVPFLEERDTDEMAGLGLWELPFVSQVREGRGCPSNDIAPRQSYKMYWIHHIGIASGTGHGVRFDGQAICRVSI